MMTAEEALALPRGSVAQALLGGRWVDVEVLRVGRVDVGGGIVMARLVVRRLERTKAGGHSPSFTRTEGAVRRPPGYDHATANVFADWLDDRGEHGAAALLRGAFPLGPG
jgi:uncharacterized protein (TIGR02996 family)